MCCHALARVQSFEPGDGGLHRGEGAAQAHQQAAQPREHQTAPLAAAQAVGLEVGARAGVHTPVSACASGAEAVGYALEMIRSGRADIVAELKARGATSVNIQF